MAGKRGRPRKVGRPKGKSKHHCPKGQHMSVRRTKHCVRTVKK